ncbi:hypothetical protein GGI17_005241 [Coemansia sp. S146]|nr:hypothetical protein GGI17_005241 [Coemansia sp. S146]
MSAQSTNKRQNTGSPVIETNPEQAPVYIYDWSSSEDMANWSLTSLSTKSIDSSFSSWSSLLTPSSEYILNEESSENVETLTGSFILDLSLLNAPSMAAPSNHSGNRRATPESPTDHVVRRRRMVATRNEVHLPDRKVSAKRHRDIDDKPLHKRRKPNAARISTRTRTIAGVRTWRRKCIYQPTALPGTPEKLSETLRPNGSPTRLCKVDKSLVCKGFWEAIEKVGRICIPCHSGKTYNLTQLLLFSSSLELDKLDDIPDSMIAEVASEMDVTALCYKKHECLFRDSPLQTMYLDFYTEHFMKYPVLYISLSECKGASFGIFLKALGNTLAGVAQKWIEEVEFTEVKVSIRARHPFEQLKSDLELYHRSRSMPASQMAEHAELTQSLFQALSKFIAKQYGKYLLLTDEYDIPFISIHLADWSAKEKKAALDILKTLFQKMLKDNGYYIGRFRGKYNPWSVSSFIEALCGLLSQTTSDEGADIAAITKSAARACWVTTGTTGLIEAQIDRHRPQFIHLAKRLLCDYEATKSKVDGGSPDKTLSEPSPPPVPLVSTRLNLINFDSELFSEPGLLTLCLYAGYLTRRLSTSVCIPNHEVYQVWLQLFARAVLGTELADNSTNNARGALLSELWENKTDLLCTLAT